MLNHQDITEFLASRLLYLTNDASINQTLNFKGDIVQELNETVGGVGR